MLVPFLVEFGNSRDHPNMLCFIHPMVNP